jgi:HlyD family secretion protein
MRLNRTVLVALALLVIVVIAVAVFVLNSGVSAPPVESRAQVKQAPAGAESSAPTRSAPSSTASTSPRPIPTDSAPAVIVSTNYVAKAIGNLTSANQATLAFQSAGRVKDIKVKEGDRVKAGDLIATLDTTALDATVVQSQAALDSAAASLAKVKAGPTVDDLIIARTNVNRTKLTLQQAQSAYDAIAWRPDVGLTSQSFTLENASDAYQAALAQYNQIVNHPTDAELKSAQATFAQAQASLETAKLNAANARITAPFDGTVVWIGLKVGESTTSGTSAVTIAELARMQVQVNVDEISSAAIKVGQAVSITLDAVPGKAFAGRVSKIGLLASTSSNMVSTPVTIDIDSSNVSIYPGLSATVEFQGRSR